MHDPQNVRFIDVSGDSWYLHRQAQACQEDLNFNRLCGNLKYDVESWSADSIITLYIHQLLHLISKYKLVFENKTYDLLAPNSQTCYLYCHQH